MLSLPLQRSSLLFLACLTALSACSDDGGSADSTQSSETEAQPTTDSDGTQSDSDSDSDTESSTENPATILLLDRLDAGALLSAELVDCTLTNGSQTQCHALTFSADIPFEDGPYCPETIDDIGGLGIYDGETNPGFQVMKKAMWDAFEADGYDIVDDQGKVRVITNLMDGVPGENGWSFCLALGLDRTLTIRYLIPVVPEDASPNQIDIVEKLGMSLAGVPLTGHPPSATEGPPGMMGGFDGFAAIPSLDHCGGHPDPMGYFHAHFVPESMNQVLEAYGIDDVSCTAFAQDRSALTGYALDGYPIYASEDPDGAPQDLDACNGHVAANAEYPEGLYHYHASPTQAPNMPTCLTGASANGSVTIQ